MNGNELAGERRTGLVERVTRSLGPAGVFFRGFLEHPRMVGSIIPSSRSTIDKMLAAARRFDPGRVKAEQVARAAGPAEETGSS